MTPFTSKDLAAWVDAQYAACLKDGRTSYELKPGEFTAMMYAEAAGVPISTAHGRLKQLRDADRIPARRELIDGKWTWIYSRVGEG